MHRERQQPGKAHRRSLAALIAVMTGLAATSEMASGSSETAGGGAAHDCHGVEGFESKSVCQQELCVSLSSSQIAEGEAQGARLGAGDGDAIG